VQKSELLLASFLKHEAAGLRAASLSADGRFAEFIFLKGMCIANLSVASSRNDEACLMLLQAPF